MASDSTEPTGRQLPPTVAQDDSRPPPIGLRPVAAEGTVAAGRYEIGRLIAQGGMGAVYAARDTVLGRRVAVKVLRPGMSTPDAADRFRAEARITSQLQHPGIPPVHDLGTLPDGGPFLAMKLIKGQTLSEELKARSGGQADLPRFVQVFEQICQAVGFAHSRGVIHRDIKPANVMVGHFGEVQVMDWGLAKDVRAAERETRSGGDDPTAGPAFVPGVGSRVPQFGESVAGSVKGTPAYMAPEQARGESVDARTDVFSLGGLLAIVLTENPPFVGNTVLDTVLMAARAELSECFEELDDCGADAELVAIAKRCLAPQPADRYADGEEVAQAVAAYRVGVEERLRKAESERAAAEVRAVELRKRRRVQAALVATVFLLALVGGGFALWSDRQEKAQKLRDLEVAADLAAADADKARAEAEQDRIAAELSAAEARAAATRRVREAGARAQVPTLLALSSDLRKQFRFKEAKAALDQAAKIAAADTPDLAGTVAQAIRDLALVQRLDEIRLTKFRPVKGKLDINKGAREYPEAFKRFGFDILGGDPTDLAKRINASAVREHLIDALDQWGLEDADGNVRRRIWDLTAAATGQSWRKNVLTARDRPDTTDQLLASIPPDQLNAALIATLGLYQHVGGGNGLRTMENGLLRFPGDFWLNVMLAFCTRNATGSNPKTLGYIRAGVAVRPDDPFLWMLLSGELAAAGDEAGAAEAKRTALRLDPTVPDLAAGSITDVVADFSPEEMIALAENVIRANPKFATAHAMLALGHQRKGNLAEAEKGAREAVRLAPKEHAGLYHDVARAWDAKGDTAAAERCYRDNIRLAPFFATSHANLGFILVRRGDYAGALPCYREAARLEAKDAVVRSYLADVLVRTGALVEAEKEARAAMALGPNLPEPRSVLGLVQTFAGDFDDAIESFRKVVAVHPNHAFAQDTLGVLLNLTEDYEGAVAAGTAAVRLEPNNVQYLVNLSRARVNAGDRAGAIAGLEKVLAAAPNHAMARGEYGKALVAEARFADALPHLRKWHELTRTLPNPPQDAADRVKDCETLVQLAERLTAVRAGKSEPKDAAERFGFARVCLFFEKRYTEAVRYYRAGFAADPRTFAPGDELRYNAAQAAVLAAAGKDPDPVPPEKRAEYRTAALTWLKDDLNAIKMGIVVRRAVGREFAIDTLSDRLRNASFATVRHPLHLATLPPEEAKEWLSLWADVRQLRDGLNVSLAPPPREK